MFGWKQKFISRKTYDALEKKYNELCAMDCQKLYGNERIKRERAEQKAAVHKAKADGLEEYTQILNGWLATLAEVIGEVSIAAGKLNQNIESGRQIEVAYDPMTEEYHVKAGEEPCSAK